MNRRVYIVSLLLATFFVMQTVQAQLAVGKWREWPDLSALYKVEQGDGCIYAAGRAGILRYDIAGQTAAALGRSTGLSDAGVSTMAFDSVTNQLLVAYSNSNVDIVSKERVHNISDIKRSEMLGDKAVYSIRFRDGMAYLATGFGIVAVDMVRHEISETYYLGTGGAATVVYDIVFSGDSLYASTGEGLKRIATSERHWGISERWHADSRLAGVSVPMLEAHEGRVVAAGYTYDPESLTLYDIATGRALTTGYIRSLRAGGGVLTVSMLEGVVRYDAALRQLDSVNHPFDWAEMPANDAFTADDGTLWVAHNWLGLVWLAPSGNGFLLPEGPRSVDIVYRLVPTWGRMMLCPGGHDRTYANSYLTPELPITDGRRWTVADKSILPAEARDVVDVAVNPTDTTEAYVAVWGTGVVHMKNDTMLTIFDDGNSNGALRRYSGKMLCGALAFDRRGNLWALNSHSPAALVERKADGTWMSHSTEALGALLQVDKIVLDSIRNYIWFAGRDNAIYVHDGASRMARVNPNSGSKLQTDNVNAIVQDRSGNIWIGTNKGIKVIYDGSQAFAGGGVGEVSPVACSNITITNGDFYEYLMAYENISAIAVDGANRKWVGTASGGLYLLSANGMEQLAHFTVANSPLLSDKIVALGIQPQSGELYVGTSAGLQVYRADATYADAEPSQHIYAFPNPVRPNYDGPIAIKGFTRDALVRITDASGHTVYSTTALGGQAIWNGRTASGERVASGVYYVFASDAYGGNRSVAKILIIR